MNKKEILFNLIDKNELEGCTLIGVPTRELQEHMLNGKNIMKLFERKGIDMPFEIDSDNLERTFINVYLPCQADGRTSNLYSISVSNKATISKELIENIIKNFFVELVDIYQFDVAPYHINKFLKLSDEDIKLEDFFIYMTKSIEQKEIAKRLNISQQFLTDLKKDRRNMSIEVLSSFMKKYPLMPWYEYILDINKCINE